MNTDVETLAVSEPALSSPVQEVKDLANPTVIEQALKVLPVSTVSELTASQLTGVSIIPAFGGLD